MDIKVLGTGCPKCKRLDQIAAEALAEVGMDAVVDHVTEIDKIMSYDILGTPGLVINGEVKSSGRLPRKEEVVAWLKEAL